MNNNPFIFYTERRLVALTGRKAGNVADLVEHLRQVTGSSIFYHTHHQYLAHHFEKPLFHNDFALWLARALLEASLAEKLTAIDLLAFGTIRQLREAILSTIESHVSENHGPRRVCVPGDEFHFCESVSFIMPSGLVAKDPGDFFDKLQRVSNISLYFHFFEARLRLERRTNDFSRWLADLGREAVASAIDGINPYVMTLDELRQEIVNLRGTQAWR